MTGIAAVYRLVPLPLGSVMRVAYAGGHIEVTESQYQALVAAVGGVTSHLTLQQLQAAIAAGLAGQRYVPAPGPQTRGPAQQTTAVQTTTRGAGMLLSSILRLLPAAAVAAIRAARGQWSRLPGWVRTVLLTIGVAEGTDIIIDDDGGQPAGGRGAGIPAVPQSIELQGLDMLDVFAVDQAGRRYDPQHGLVVGGWIANGIPFVRFSDGYQAAWAPSKNRWTYWRPPRPIVLHASGASSPQMAARAHAALRRQAKRLKPMVDQYYPRRQRRTRTQTRTVQADGTTIIQASND